ncbi:MAG TPA: 2-oxo acid dehydrogenase subunit E2, partial [Blastocatellia bacterium]|nr:2-oxo acid dehydrogenase subunit E2 [Blastocatellia bacterium]
MRADDPTALAEMPGPDQIIEAEFGVNADYVGELFKQFQRDRQSVDDEWRAFFDDILPQEPAPQEPGTRPSDGPQTQLDVRKQGNGTATPAASELETAGRSGYSAGGSSSANATGPSADKARPKVAVEDHPATADKVSGAVAQAAAPALEGKPSPERLPLRGPALRIAQNMEASLGVPTATSQRQVPVKLLEENRRLINEHIKRARKVSYTHIVARAILKALEAFPRLNDSFEQTGAGSFRVAQSAVNLGLAVDVTRKDGSRALLVPNIKAAEKLSFPELLDAYDSAVTRAREGKLQVDDFQGTTISLTNPGTLGTTASNPRLMAGQGLIIATGAIEYAPEYHAMSSEALSRLGISKVMTLTSTYDHRIIQGAESGSFLAFIDQLLRGDHQFYEQIFHELAIPFRPYKWAVDRNPAILGERKYSDEVRKQARVWELVNAYRVRGHLTADINPLRSNELPYHPELDIDSYGLTIWDLDREFISGGLGENETAPLREI